MATLTKKTGLAYATRTSGNTYDVTYRGHADMDRNVPYEYLRRLAREGYTVRVHDTIDGDHTVTV